MPALSIETSPYLPGIEQKTVTGFTDAEISELQSMELHEAEDRVLEMLDERNGNTGTCWKCGYGVYGFALGTKGCTFRIGTSCD